MMTLKKADDDSVKPNKGIPQWVHAYWLAIVGGFGALTAAAIATTAYSTITTPRVLDSLAAQVTQSKGEIEAIKETQRVTMARQDSMFQMLTILSVMRCRELRADVMELLPQLCNAAERRVTRLP